VKTNIPRFYPLNDSKKLSLLQHGHCVQFYTTNDELLQPLTTFITSALKKDKTFIVIATSDHLQSISATLQVTGIDVSEAQSTGQYVAMDASQTLSKFMVDGLPDADRFNDIFGSLLTKTAQRGQPVHAYGEMVAVLWKQGNKEAVLQLEALWNQILHTKSVSLYCAYPVLHFTMHSDVLEQIRSCHSFNFTKLVKN
jgi:hypothetical protein